MEPIETIAWHEIIDHGELHDWHAAQLAPLGFPGGSWPKPSPTTWTGTKSLRWLHPGRRPRLALNIVL